MKKLEFIQDPDKLGDDAVVVSDKKRRKLDIFPKIICLLIAIVVWLWMVNLNDTEATETKLLKIEYMGIQAEEDGNVMIYGIDKSEITVTIKGSNRDLKKYADSEYRAVVDLSNLDAKNINAGERITLPITVHTPQNSSLKVSESNDLNVSMFVDTYMVKEVPFDAMVEKSNDDTNTYEKIINIIGNDSGSNTITISGPSKIVGLIHYARYNIKSDLLLRPDGNGFADDKVFNGSDSQFPLTFLNENYHSVNGTDGMVNYSTEGIGVLVNVIAHKEVAVRVQVSAGASGNSLTAHTSPGTIKIAGRPSVLADINEYLVTLPSASENATYPHTIVAPPTWSAYGVKIENTETQMQITFSSEVEGKR